MMRTPIDKDRTELAEQLRFLITQARAALTLLEAPGMTVHDPDYCNRFREKTGTLDYDFVVGDFAVKALKKGRWLQAGAKSALTETPP